MAGASSPGYSFENRIPLCGSGALLVERARKIGLCHPAEPNDELERARVGTLLELLRSGDHEQIETALNHIRDMAAQRVRLFEAESRLRVSAGELVTTSHIAELRLKAALDDQEDSCMTPESMNGEIQNFVRENGDGDLA